MYMDYDNNMLLEKYFSSHSSPYERTNKVSKHVKFVNPDINFEKKLLEIYSVSGTNNLPSIYKIVHENFKDVEMSLSHSEGYKHIYCSILGDYELEGCQVHFLHPRPKVSLYENASLEKWSSLAIFKKGTSTALFRI